MEAHILLQSDSGDVLSCRVPHTGLTVASFMSVRGGNALNAHRWEDGSSWEAWGRQADGMPAFTCIPFPNPITTIKGLFSAEIHKDKD